MKKIRNFKLFAGMTLFAQSLVLVAVIVILSVQKKSVPKALIAVFAAGSFLSAWLLISYNREQVCKKRLQETDALYDHDYADVFDDEEDYGLGIDENLNMVRDGE